MKRLTILTAALLVYPTLAGAQDLQWSQGEHYFIVVAESLATAAGLGTLTQRALPADDIDLRVWAGYGLTGVYGLVLQRTAGEWSAFRVTERTATTDWPRRSAVHSPVQAPWPSFYDFVCRMGLLELPDRPARADSMVVSDGHSVVIQLRRGQEYRTWVYDNPDVFRTPEDLRVLAIADSAATLAWIR